ncbi:MULTISPECIES: DUF4232 domain-containing protein [unclassified Streptomyces]|uniref:DUF4232 domain-containing protein n=1 Tax=unclassified Streptomyces TaxID=2593676 RepID=UPI0011A0AE26|nr:DUF4232 domain-containing protein [Streptomyces sp. BK340]TVZ81439.1 uncharacterized protein DUF4232 [Streptomyces sp. BK340]
MRTRRTHLFAVTGVALTALALTACGSGTGTRDEGASKTSFTEAPATGGKGTVVPASGKSTDSGSASGSSGSANGSSGSANGSSTSSGSGSSGSPGSSSAGSGRSSDPWDPKNRVLCNGSNTKVTAQPVSRPLNHMIITVRNTGSKYCDLTYFPILRFDEMQWVPQADEETHPQAVTTLAPGESGYAAVLLSAADGSGEGGTTGHKLVVGFQGKTPNSSGGASATPALPAKGVYYDSSLKVTYWQHDLDDIAGW